MVERTMPGDEALEREILAYFAEHPLAMDDAAGIAKWWLNHQTSQRDPDSLTRTLGRLVDRGVLETIGGQHEPLYRLRDRAKRPKP